MPRKKKVRMGFIGGGGISRTHMRYLAEMEDVELLAVADVSQPALEQCREAHGFEHCFTDYRKLLKVDGLDAVSVCTPNSMHHRPTVEALKAGLDVMVEKPMAMNAKEAGEMVRTAEERGRLLVIGFQHRFRSNAQMLKRSIDSGVFGKVLYARCQALRRRGIPNWGVFGRKELQGGGPMIDIGVHIMEVAHYLMGAPKPVSAFGSTYTYLGDRKSSVVSSWPDWDHKTYTVEDLAVGMIRFDNGATLTVESTFAAHLEHDVFDFVLMGEKAGGRFDPPMIFKDEADTMVNLAPGFLPNDDCFEYKMRHFIDCVRTGKPSQAPGEHGLLVQQMLDGIYKSAETGREVRIG